MVGPLVLKSQSSSADDLSYAYSPTASQNDRGNAFIRWKEDRASDAVRHGEFAQTVLSGIGSDRLNAWDQCYL